MDVDYPVKVKNVVSRLTASTQKALQQRLSRIIIELPPGADFGVESRKGSMAAGTDDPVERTKRSNRESARLFTEMFSVLSTTTTVQFPTESEAAVARSVWGSKFKGQVLGVQKTASKGMGKTLYSQRMSKEEKEKALIGSDGIYVPEGTELLIFAGVNSKDLRRIYDVHTRLGPECLIILLNARLRSSNLNEDDADSIERRIEKEFVSVFHYSPPLMSPNVIGKRELLLFYELGGTTNPPLWYLAEKKAPNESEAGLLSNIMSKVKGEEMTTLWKGANKPSEGEIIDVLRSS
eukprot:gene43288-52910_t